MLDKGDEPKEVRTHLRSILASHAEGHPEDKQKRQAAVINRLLGTLRNLRKEIECSNVVSKERLREMDQLISKIEGEIVG